MNTLDSSISIPTYKNKTIKQKYELYNQKKKKKDWEGDQYENWIKGTEKPIMCLCCK